MINCELLIINGSGALRAVFARRPRRGIKPCWGSRLHGQSVDLLCNHDLKYF